MMRLLYTLILAAFMNSGHAQSQLCLKVEPGASHINFKPDDLNRFCSLDHYKVVFFGEQHNAVFHPELKFYLITDLYKRSGIRHVFMETSVSRAWHYNQFLRTGDTSHLYTSAASQALTGYILMWKRLFEFNKGLPEGSKITIHGVDFETSAVFPTLKMLTPTGKPVPSSLKPMMDTVNAHLADKPLHMWDIIDNKFIVYDNSGFTATLRYVQKQLLDHDDDVKAYFGDSFPVVHDIAINSGKVEVKARNRNKTMFAAIARAVEKDSIDKFIGFFGNQHTAYSVHNSLPNAVKKLKGISKKDILTIAEYAYNVKSKETAFRGRHYEKIVDLNKECKASVHPAIAVPGFSNQSDFVVISNITE